MSQITKHMRLGALTLSLTVLGLTACTEYAIETTVNPDGSGIREERIETAENSDVSVTPAQFSAVMYTGPEAGWNHEEEVDSDGDTYHIFERRTPVSDLAAWSGLGGKVRIDGAVPANSQTRVGYVSLGDVRFRNAIHLRRAADSDGNVSFTFRETFTWERAADALAEFLVGGIEEAVSARYRDLSEAEVGQIVGFARARFWVAVEGGLFSGDGDEEQLLSDVARQTSQEAVKVVQVRYPGEGMESISDLLTEVLVESDDRFMGFIEGELPGLNIAFNSEIVFRLNMPGRITDSNAHDRDGTTLVWEFGPGDALHTPVEIYAESVMEG